MFDVLFLIIGLFIGYGFLATATKLYHNPLLGYDRIMLLQIIIIIIACLAALIITVFKHWHTTDDNTGIAEYLKENMLNFVSGLCSLGTAFLTILLYSYRDISVLVVSIIMTSGVMLSGRIVDYILVKQKLKQIRHNKYSNIAFILSMCSLAIILLHDVFTVSSKILTESSILLLAIYVIIFGFRVYIINYYKIRQNNFRTFNSKHYYFIERLSAVLVIIIFLLSLLLYNIYIGDEQTTLSIRSIFNMLSSIEFTTHLLAAAAGLFFGIGLMCSGMLLLNKKMNASTSTLLNRGTILLVGFCVTIFVEVLILEMTISPYEIISFIFMLAAFIFVFISGKELNTAKNL